MSHCEPCKKVKQHLEQSRIPYEHIDVDIADMDDWDKATEILGENMPSPGVQMIFPMIYVDGSLTLQGYSERQLNELVKHVTQLPST